MSPYHEEAIGAHVLGDVSEHVTLHRFAEIGECHIAAENEIEFASWLLEANVLVVKLDARLPVIAKTVDISAVVERVIDPVRREISQAALGVAGCTGAFEQVLVDIGGNDGKTRLGVPGTDTLIP